MIDNFRGKYYFLSNFYNAPVEYEGILYTNNEAAFQSAKLKNKNLRTNYIHNGMKYNFATLDPSTAKKFGRHLNLRSDWEEVKFDIMYELVYDKFNRNQKLRQKLLLTDNEELVEGNTWGDRIWGKCNGKGQNNLGKILMRVREELRNQ